MIPIDSNDKVSMRLDKWLWCARFHKTRRLATEAIKTGKVTVNDKRVKPSRSIKPGDKISIRRAPYHFDITVSNLGTGRKSTADAGLLYQESPDSLAARNSLAEQLKAEAAMFPQPKGRPSKRKRRDIIRFTRISRTL